MKRKYKKLYPITLSMVANQYELVGKIFLNLVPHKGAYIGVAELNGTIMCDSPGELFSELVIGEKLLLSYNRDDKNGFFYEPEVRRADGTYLGLLPGSEGVLPNMLYSRGIDVWCHLEAKEFKGGMLRCAVSIYCEEY